MMVRRLIFFSLSLKQLMVKVLILKKHFRLAEGQVKSYTSGKIILRELKSGFLSSILP